MKNNLGFTLILTLSFFSVILSQVIITNMPYNPLRQGTVETSVAALLPQGWAFFTRSPREPQIYLYHEVDGQIVKKSYPNASLESAFGFNRKVRSKGIELGHLYERSQKLEWTECDGDVNICNDNWTATEAQDIINPAHTPSICGELYIVEKVIIPWAWASSKKEIHMPSKIIKLNAVCLQQTN
ncbi:MAG: SdpA family antimicrobial peptide system protein [Saprospiraceae bacterium]